MREELDKTNTLSRLAVVLHDARDAVTVQNLDGRIIAWNPSAAKIYGWSETEALAMNASDRIPAQLYEEELNKIRQLMNGELLELFPSQRICRSGKIINVAVIYTALVNQDGLMYAVATTERAKDVE
jgi:two-component system CheB/CheR fusion protein